VVSIQLPTTFWVLAGRSGHAFLQFGALLAKQAAEPVDLVAELADLLGQR
jgi:hypothetical protein